MNFKTKRHYKKMARIYFTIAWAMTIAWILYVITCIVIIVVTSHPNAPTNDNKGGFFILILFLLPLITAVVLGWIGQEYMNKRIRYKKQINEYRQRRFFTQIIDLLRRGNITDAVIIYNKLLTDDTFRNFTFPFIICESIHSSDDNRKKIGTDKLYDILEKYNPENMIF